MSKRRDRQHAEPAEVDETPAPDGSGLTLRFGTWVLYPLTLLALAFWIGMRPLRDPDLWFHMALGREFISGHGLPKGDIFSSTAVGAEWISSGWLSSVLYQWAFALFGEGGGGVTALASLAGGVGLLIVYTLSVLRGGRGALAAGLALAAMAAAGRFTPRPDVFSIPMFAAVAALLLTATDKLSNIPAVFPRRLYALPLLVALWANLHAGVFSGVAVIVLFALWLAGLVKQTGFGGWKDARSRALIICGVACLAWLLNPYGYRLAALPGKIASIPEVQWVYEWMPLMPSNREFRLPWPVYIGFAGVVTLGLATIFLRGESRMPWWQWVFIAACLIVACAQRRQIGLGMIGLLAVAAVHCRVWERALEEGIWPIPTLNVGAALMAFVVVKTGAAGLQPGNPATGRDCSLLPCHAAEFLAQNPPPGNMFNPYNYGGYLTYTVGPTTKVFIDGRLDVYPHQVWLDMLALEENRMDLNDAIKKYDLRTFLVSVDTLAIDPNHLINRLLARPDCKLVHFDDDFAVVVRDDAESKEYLSKWGYKYLQPFSPKITLKALTNPKLRPAIIAEAKRALEQSSGSANALALAGLASMSQSFENFNPSNFREAYELFSAAGKRRPNSPALLYAEKVVAQIVEQADKKGSTITFE